MFGWLKRNPVGAKNIASKSTVGPAQENRPSVTPVTARLSLLLEGTSFAMFVEEAPFFQTCRNLNQAALRIPFKEFWPVGRRGAAQKAVGGGMRLLCARCFNEMPFSFQMALPGGFGGSMIAFGSGLPSNLGGSAKQATCPWCSSDDGIIVWDNASHGEIADTDLSALRALWRQRCSLWWKLEQRDGTCERCNSQGISEGQGYFTGSQLLCEKCANNSTAPEVLAKLREKPDYFGTSELRRARNFAAKKWNFEVARTVQEK
jgi:hypothetical protein